MSSTETLAQLGEFGLIHAIQGQVGPCSDDVVMGIGDDAAVIRAGGGVCWLWTTDMLVEGIHFVPGTAWPDVGHKALACSISDIAAMGGEPRYALVSMGISGRQTVEAVRGLYRGLQETANDFGVNIIGGDTVASDRTVVNIAMTGQVEADRVVYRHGARPGDRLFVTGPLGRSFVSGHHLRFTPRLSEARMLTDRFHPTSMMDISDGLASDLRHILERSGVGAVLDLEKIPRREGASIQEALNDGEDFELLFTLPAGEADRCPFFCVGRIVEEGEGMNISRQGFDHFDRRKHA